MTCHSPAFHKMSCHMKGNIMEHRVVITGIGAIVPGAFGAEQLWKRVAAGSSALGKLTMVDTTGLPTQTGGEIPAFDPLDYMEARLARKMDRYSQLSVSSSILACRDAEFDPSSLSDASEGVFEGSSFGPLVGTLNCYRSYLANVCDGIRPHLLMTSMAGSGSGFISLILHSHGPAMTISDGSASSTSAIGQAFRKIKCGLLDVALAGGSEAPLSREIIATFCSARLLSTQSRGSNGVMRPFDKDRDGFVLSEGAVFLFMESLEHALRRDAQPYAEIVGFAETGDAYHPTSPHPDGTWIARAMKLAMEEACMQASDIQYINAHGTATKINDVVEAKAIRAVFGRSNENPAVSSTKPVTGHLLGASGATECAITAMAMKHQFVPGTATLQNVDPDCELKNLPVDGAPLPIYGAINNNYSFGGRNTTIVFRSMNQVNI